MFALTLIFLLYPPSKKMSKERLFPLDIILALLALSTGIYYLIEFERITTRIMFVDPVTNLDILFGTITIILVLEATRRTVGPPLTALAIAFLAYLFLSPLLPGVLYFRGLSVKEIIEFQFLTTDALYGIPVGVSATYIFLFILFAAFLQQTGVGKFFMDLAFALTGRSRGGPAKAAVVGSSLMGTLMGSGSGNVAATGVFTIPLMKKAGYKPHFAGAVEAVASTGGQIMPPVMGSAAFIMAEFTNIPYWNIALAAAIPAILYYIAVFMMVHLEAVKQGLKGMPKEELPNLKQTLKRGIHLFTPLIVVVYLLSNGYSPNTAALWALVSTVVVSLFRKDTRITPRKFVNALIEGAKMATFVAAACAAAGIVLGVIIYSGLGLRLTSIMVNAAGGNLLLTLIFVAIGSLILGMGMGTNAVYVTVAALMVPALILMKVPLLAAHMFAFYFGCVSLFTPPVATAAFVAAGLAGAGALRTGFTATRLGIVAFIVPFMFVYGPSLLLLGSPVEIISSFATASIGVCALAMGLQGYAISKIGIPERILFFIAAVSLMHPDLMTDVIGLGLLSIPLFVQLRKSNYHLIHFKVRRKKNRPA
jgi:TRAP transporter 4TM/12TM fusion protein